MLAITIPFVYLPPHTAGQPKDVLRMKLSRDEANLLRTFISLANKLLEEKEARVTDSKSKRSASGGRRRRSREEAAKVKQEIAAARARGVAVKKISAKYGVTPAYVYQITGPMTK